MSAEAFLIGKFSDLTTQDPITNNLPQSPPSFIEINVKKTYCSRQLTEVQFVTYLQGTPCLNKHSRI